MFKSGLLISTAMTAVTLLLSGAPAGAYVQTDMHVADRDTNGRFLCTYGQFEVSFGWSGQSSYNQSDWKHVAVSVKGRGQTVSRIIVMEAQNRSEWSTSSFSAGIYSSNRNGFPGKLIAGGIGNAPPTCGPVTIPIAPTTLQANTKYWIEEKAHRKYPSSSYISLYWAANPKAKRRAYVQTYKHTCFNSSHCSHVTSHWTKQSSGPWFKLK